MKKILGALLTLFTLSAFAWQPTKPVTVVFPNGPGAGNEISFRIVAKIVEEKNPSFKWNPEYKPGADGNIGMNHFDKLPADGHHVAMPSCQSTFVTAEIWYANSVKFNAMDWEGVANIGKAPLAFYARTSSNIDTPQKLIAEVHVLAFEGDSQVRWFEGNFSEYEEFRRREFGADANQPHRIKYKPLVR